VGIDDIGPQTIAIFKKEIENAQTIVWNGPLGVFEKKESAAGTREIAQVLAESPAYKVVGGGDTVAALKRFNLRDKIDFVSTGGGALLEFLADGTLPGLEVLGWKKA
jgi:phosphoglycerate kinase